MAKRTSHRARQREAYRAVLGSMGPRRGLGAPLRDDFYRCEVAGEARFPLAQLMSSRSGPGGGRGGRTRVALYLSLLWVAASDSHSSQRPASFWASLLGMRDPDNAGSRVVRSTWTELASHGFVQLEHGTRSGDVPVVHALREDGSKRFYTRPSGVLGDTYRRIPQIAWENLLPEEEGLTGPGLAMYLVAVRTALQAGSTTGLTFPAKSFRTQYGLSETTRKAGLANLTDLAVLDKHLHSTDSSGGVGGRRRLRNSYDLLEEYAAPPARPADPFKPDAGHVPTEPTALAAAATMPQAQL